MSHVAATAGPDAQAPTGPTWNDRPATPENWSLPVPEMRTVPVTIPPAARRETAIVAVGGVASILTVRPSLSSVSPSSSVTRMKKHQTPSPGWATYWPVVLSG